MVAPSFAAALAIAFALAIRRWILGDETGSLAQVTIGAPLAIALRAFRRSIGMNHQIAWTSTFVDEWHQRHDLADMDMIAAGEEHPMPADTRDNRLVRPGGRTVAWVETGVLNGRPILRLPGLPGSRLTLRADKTPWFARGLRVINTERMGFGASTRLPGRGYNEHADDLAAILDWLRIDRLPLYGASGAAPHILAFAARHPDRVTAATILVGGAPLTDDEVDRLIGLNADAYQLAMAGDRGRIVTLLAPVRDALVADPIASFREIMRTAPSADQEIMADPAWQAALALGIREAFRPAGVEGWVDEWWCMCWSWGEIDLEAVQTSLTWWHADGDRNSPLSAVRRLLAQLPSARLVVWPDAGHLTPYKHEDEILDELLARSDDWAARGPARGPKTRHRGTSGEARP